MPKLQDTDGILGFQPLIQCMPEPSFVELYHQKKQPTLMVRRYAPQCS